MKIEVATPNENLHPLIGAEVVFTKHSKKNQEHIGAKYWLTLGKVYTVVNYSDYPKIGDGPRIMCDHDSTGDVPMRELDYDIISRPNAEPIKPVFSPVTITLENQDEVAFLRNAFGNSVSNVGHNVYCKLNNLCGY